MPYLVFGLIMGGAVAAIAHSKGRTPVGWFFIGFFFGIIGLIVVLVSSNLNQEKYLRARQDEENRRLREQLRQERVKHETLREYTMKRLDVHDQVLGVDTKTVQALPTENNPAFLPAGEAADPASPSPASQPAPQPVSNAWYFEQNGETRGPVPADVIRSMLANGQISGTTLLWADHLRDWRPAALIPEIQDPAT